MHVRAYSTYVLITFFVPPSLRATLTCATSLVPSRRVSPFLVPSLSCHTLSCHPAVCRFSRASLSWTSLACVLCPIPSLLLLCALSLVSPSSYSVPSLSCRASDVTLLCTILLVVTSRAVSLVLPCLETVHTLPLLCLVPPPYAPFFLRSSYSYVRTYRTYVLYVLGKN